MNALDRRRGLLAVVAAAIGLAAGFAVVLLSVDAGADEPAAEAGQVESEPTSSLPSLPTSAVASAAANTLDAVAIDPATTTTATATTVTSVTNAVTSATTTSLLADDTTPPDCGTTDHLASLLLAHDELSQEFEDDWNSALDEWLQFVAGEDWDRCKGELPPTGGSDHVMCVKHGNAASVDGLGETCVDLVEPIDSTSSGAGGDPASELPPPMSCAAPGRYGLVLISSTPRSDDDHRSRFDAVTKNVLSDFVNVFGNDDISNDEIESCKQALVEVVQGPVRCVYVGDPGVYHDLPSGLCEDLAEFDPDDRPPATNTLDGT